MFWYDEDDSDFEEMDDLDRWYKSASNTPVYEIIIDDIVIQNEKNAFDYIRQSIYPIRKYEIRIYNNDYGSVYRTLSKIFRNFSINVNSASGKFRTNDCPFACALLANSNKKVIDISSDGTGKIRLNLLAFKTFFTNCLEAKFIKDKQGVIWGHTLSSTNHHNVEVFSNHVKYSDIEKMAEMLTIEEFYHLPEKWSIPEKMRLQINRIKRKITS
ncbi:MAG: hypothetical protein SFU91_11460 [Chloroherpetonaceae bacterium]|nr:hypothetical protein [Chloroherpetonaceae bacterium]